MQYMPYHIPCLVSWLGMNICHDEIPVQSLINIKEKIREPASDHRSGCHIRIDHCFQEGDLGLINSNTVQFLSGNFFKNPHDLSVSGIIINDHGFTLKVFSIEDPGKKCCGILGK